MYYMGLHAGILDKFLVIALKLQCLQPSWSFTEGSYHFLLPPFKLLLYHLKWLSQLLSPTTFQLEDKQILLAYIYFVSRSVNICSMW